MKLLIDTGTWLKINYLIEKKVLTHDFIYNYAEIYITHQVEKEVNYFKPKSFIREKTIIIPVGDKTLYNENVIYFGEADASLISYGTSNYDKNKDFIIISEDRPLLNFGKIYRFFIIQLIDLFLIFTELSLLSKKELYQLNRALFSLKNISKRKEKEINNWIQTFH